MKTQLRLYMPNQRTKDGPLFQPCIVEYDVNGPKAKHPYTITKVTVKAGGVNIPLSQMDAHHSTEEMMQFIKAKSGSRKRAEVPA